MTDIEESYADLFSRGSYRQTESSYENMSAHKKFKLKVQN